MVHSTRRPGNWVPPPSYLSAFPDGGLPIRQHVIFAFTTGMVTGATERSFIPNHDALGMVIDHAVATAAARAFPGPIL